MSRNMIVSKRYAKALFEAAADRKIVAEVEQELKVIVGLIEADDDFRKFLEHPNIDNSNKITVLESTLKDHVSDIMFSTLMLIVTRGRESILPSLLQYYITVANESLGKADAIVYAPYALSDKENKAIAKRFSKITGKTIHIDQVVVDKNLLGGLRVRIGDRLYDGSLAGKLANLEDSLKQIAL